MNRTAVCAAILAAALGTAAQASQADISHLIQVANLKATQAQNDALEKADQRREASRGERSPRHSKVTVLEHRRPVVTNLDAADKQRELINR